jgi:hypothetical protein
MKLNKAKSTGESVDTHVAEDDILKRAEFRGFPSADEKYEVLAVQRRLPVYLAAACYRPLHADGP